MHPLADYAAYLEDNPEGYWFKRKLYGWGWVPATWQGWVVVGIYLSYFANISLHAGAVEPYLLRVASATAILFFVCFATGERPRFQWGIPASRA